MARAAQTLILLTPQRLVRADFSAGTAPTILHLHAQARPDIEDLSTLVEVAIAQGPKIGKKVYLLSQDVFSQTVRLDAKSFGLTGTELANALAFEVEPYSGISPFEAAVSYRQITAQGQAEREFWVVESRTLDVDQCREAVLRVGGRLAGIAPAVDLAQAAPSRAATGIRDMSLTLDSATDTRTPLNIDDTESLQAWLTNWASYFDKPTGEVPLLVPAGRPLTAGQRNAVSGLIALAVAAACASHYFLFAETSIQRLEAEIKVLQDKQGQATAIDKMIADTEKKKTEQTQANLVLEKNNKAFAVQRDRLAKFMTHLGKLTPQEVLIQKIESKNGDMVVRGLALKPEYASQLAAQLSDPARGLGWDLLAPTSKAILQLRDGGPWEFELTLQDILVPKDAGSRQKFAD